MNKFIKNTVIYFLLILGYILIHFFEIENYIYKQDGKQESKSKVNFIYQQF